MDKILDYDLIKIGSYKLDFSSLIFLAILITVVIILLRLVKRSIYRVHKFDLAKKYSINRLVKYVIIIFSFIISLQILGFNLSVLLAGSAALLVGLGLGLQNLFGDFISGVILLIDSSIKVGDIIEVNGLVCQVQAINLRTTTVLTRDDKYIILPNSELTRHQLINWTHSDITSRFEVSVGVAYSSDIHLVMKIMEQVAVEHDQINKIQMPFVRFEDYADSSLVFTLYFWCDKVFRVENVKSDLRVKIFEAFSKSGVEIPFPQRVVHLKNH